MKKIIKTFIISLFTFTSLSTFAIDPKLMVAAKMAGYGTVGGTLLGAATLAFGGGGRNIAKGASLGLYAGLIFGAYVVTSYEMRKKGWGQEKDEEYYQEEGDYEGSMFQRNFDELDALYADREKNKANAGELALVVPVLSLNF